MSTATVTAPSALSDRVAAGAAYLDDTDPGWRSGIDLERLNLSRVSRCILGQLNGFWGNLMFEAELERRGLSFADAVRMGFALDPEEYRGRSELVAFYMMLTEAWRIELTA